MFNTPRLALLFNFWSWVWKFAEIGHKIRCSIRNPTDWKGVRKTKAQTQIVPIAEPVLYYVNQFVDGLLAIGSTATTKLKKRSPPIFLAART